MYLQEGEELTLWMDSAFTKSMVGKTAVLQAIARTAEGMLGHPVRCKAAVGKPPAPGAARPKRAAARKDKLDELVETGKQFDNVVIE